MKRYHKRRSTRIERIERKCDRILSELLVLRRQIAGRPDMDAAIDRLHRAARRMRMQCEKERDSISRLFGSQYPEP